MKKLVTPQFDPLKVYMNAESFRVADMFLRTAGKDPNLMNEVGMPQMVLSAFASELYLKCLMCLETGKVPPTHNLKALFRDLTAQTQNRIKQLWKDRLPELEALFAIMERSSGKRVPRDLIDALDASGDAFVRLRYVHENPKSTFVVGDLPLLLQRVILEMMPQWANIRRTPPTELSR